MANEFILIKNNGEKIYNPKIQGLTLKFENDNNKFIVYESTSFNSCVFNLRGSANVIIKKDCRINLTSASIGRCEINIGERTTINGAWFAMNMEPNLKVEIGNDCQIADKTKFWPCDGHTLIDKTTGKIINEGKSIKIGNHVWIGQDCHILKGVNIPDNVVIAACTTLVKSSNKILKPFCVAGGNPVRVLKDNIDWHYLDTYRYKHNNKYINNQSYKQEQDADSLITKSGKRTKLRLFLSLFYYTIIVKITKSERYINKIEKTKRMIYEKNKK